MTTSPSEKRPLRADELSVLRADSNEPDGTRRMIVGDLAFDTDSILLWLSQNAAALTDWEIGLRAPGGTWEHEVKIH